MQRGLSLEAVSKVTKIQPRILERLEAGKLEGLPAEVFVRGFVRSVARCVGLDEDEALRRYAACGLATGTADLTPTVRALVEAMVDLAPGSNVAAPRATPRRMQAVDAPEILDLGSPTMPLTGAVVETMMLPETGTVVMPAQLAASASMSMLAVSDRDLPLAPSTSPAGSFDALPMTEPAAPEAAAVAEPAAVAVPVAAAAPAAVAEPAAVAAVPVAAPVPVAAAVAVAVEPAAETGKKKRSRRSKRNKRASDAPVQISRDLLATGTPAEPSPIVVASEPTDTLLADTSLTDTSLVTAEPAITTTDAALVTADEPIATETWAPKMPPIAAAPSVPWRRPAYAAAPAIVVPSLVIDDADPDSAERVLEERAETLAPRRSFLPPILLDREDRSARQGGLTLAVIILLIAATLTLSYLMRRPSASGDGMTRLETPASYVG